MACTRYSCLTAPSPSPHLSQHTLSAHLPQYLVHHTHTSHTPCTHRMHTIHAPYAHHTHTICTPCTHIIWYCYRVLHPHWRGRWCSVRPFLVHLVLQNATLPQMLMVLNASSPQQTFTRYAGGVQLGHHLHCSSATLLIIDTVHQLHYSSTTLSISYTGHH